MVHFAHMTNSMGQTDREFEAGEENGAAATLRPVVDAVRIQSTPSGRP
jgi:hypothetical protein